MTPFFPPGPNLSLCRRSQAVSRRSITRSEVCRERTVTATARSAVAQSAAHITAHDLAVLHRERVHTVLAEKRAEQGAPETNARRRSDPTSRASSRSNKVPRGPAPKSEAGAGLPSVSAATLQTSLLFRRLLFDERAAAVYLAKLRLLDLARRVARDVCEDDLSRAFVARHIGAELVDLLLRRRHAGL